LTAGKYALRHVRDYGNASGVYYGANDSPAVESKNTAVRAAVLAGVVRIAYSTGITPAGESKTFDIPVYVEVRNCLKTFQ
jgi:ribosomal protein L25 (general stress protein Ctc)